MSRGIVKSRELIDVLVLGKSDDTYLVYAKIDCEVSNKLISQFSFEDFVERSCTSASRWRFE